LTPYKLHAVQSAAILTTSSFKVMVGTYMSARRWMGETSGRQLTISQIALAGTIGGWTSVAIGIAAYIGGW